MESVPCVILQCASWHFNHMLYLSRAKLLKAYVQLKVLGFPLNCCKTRGYAGWFSDISILKWRKSMGTFHSHPSEWKKSHSEENVCSLPQSCLRFIWPVLGRILLFDTLPFFLIIFGRSLGKVPSFYLVLLVPQVWTFEHYKVTVEWPQKMSVVTCPTTNVRSDWTSSHCFCSLDSAIALASTLCLAGLLF